MDMLRVSLIVAVLAGGLAGCPQQEERHVIRGRADFPERIKMAPGAAFTVQLVDAGRTEAPNAVVASRTYDNVAGPPYPFELDATLRPNGRYALEGMLRAADGSLLFVTDPRVPVTPGADAPVDLRMTRVRGPAEPAPAPARIERAQWTCDGMTFEATFDLTGERVALALPSDTLSLPRAESPSGARYADHRGNEFSMQGDTGTLTRAGGGKVDCVRADAPLPADSPWAKARDRGIAFRAIGNEPGWLVEVGQGETPTLHAELDYGERKVDVPQVRTLSGLLGYGGTAPDGTRIRLVLERKACSDGMSDTTYPVEATFEVGDKAYKGCGRFLAE